MENRDKAIEIIESVIEDLEKVAPLILKYIKQPIAVMGKPKFYTLQKADQLKKAVKILKGV